MRIRAYRSGDLQALRRLTVEAFAGVSIDQNMEKLFGPIHGHDWRWRKARQLDADADLHPQGIFLAEEGDHLLGFVTTRVDAEAGIGHIPHLVVSAESRGQGIGRRLIGHALDYFRSLGLTHAQIETLEQNATGRHLFPACGFQEIARKIYYARSLEAGGWPAEQ
jgi:ribosomal protein S18 acetylase RimI-like enzyme